MMIRKTIALAALITLSASAFALAPNDPPPTTSEPVPIGVTSKSGALSASGALSSSDSAAASAARSNAAIDADLASQAEATGGAAESSAISDAAATGGEAQALARGSGDASNATNVSNSTMVMGTIIANGCGSGVQAGHSDKGGNAGFFGVTWTTSKCYALMTGEAFAAVGDYELACELWVAVNARTFRKRGRKDIDCAERARALRAYQESLRTPREVQIPPAEYVTREELREREDRMLKKLIEK